MISKKRKKFGFSSSIFQVLFL